ncbi:MAG: putative chemoreceptor glutamine deamidase CheD 1, partial [Pseudomonadota bacterium]
MKALLERAATHPRPPVAPGFDHIQRNWDPAIKVWSAKILPGEYFVTAHDEAITTILGSCISACIRDTAIGVGGMNHFMLPEDTSSGTSSWLDPSAAMSTRYGSFAMESLINDLMKQGARRERLEIKLFGGGNILTSMTDVGARNIEFVHRWLKTEGLRVTVEDVGDVCPRRIVYFPTVGKVLVKRLRSLDGKSIAERE